MNKHELSKIFKIINDAMNFQGLTYESLFAKFDKFNENEISLADFKYFFFTIYFKLNFLNFFFEFS